ncbi:hypothetical protein CAPN001_21300 [Capnocytophaga stomatis]|uniref:hypothetical protein n=1 Tax=Capnocytophaga stomatis TaxID=1848904 RepID=UPI0019506063|nr:hypothetical protein [Capnocytophaga stomatis]GIJ97561.1 hypothetical protein CAPN001_21300 [Capnocytophaga stomatis]
MDYLNFNYLPIEGHVVEQIKLYYQQKVEALAYKIKSNPLNCQQYENEIRELRTYAQNDKFIHKIKASYYAYHQMLKDNEEFCRTYPELCQKYIDEKLKEWGGNSKLV